mgnify:CR=1 FL=1
MSNNSFSRRDFIRLTGTGFVTAASLASVRYLTPSPARAEETSSPHSPDEALKVLMEGNERFASSMKEGPGRSAERRTEAALGQTPFSAILACSDSRVAPEIIFDQGIGDLFVVRVAGNIVNPVNYGIQGSLQFGVLALGAKLVMVLGHTARGALTGPIQAIQKGKKCPGENDHVVKSIKPAVEKAETEKGDLLYNATIENVMMGVERLTKSDPVISGLVREGKVKVVGANYDLITGEVKLAGRV